MDFKQQLRLIYNYNFIKILEICKNNDLKTNIVMCSAYDSQDNLNQAQASGMIDYITKPVKPNKLKYIIEKYL